MQILTKRPTVLRTNHKARSPRFHGSDWSKCLWLLLIASTIMLSACGGGSSTSSQSGANLSGNWQFSMDNPEDSSGNTPFMGGLQGGFLLQKNGALNGAVVYAVTQLNSSSSAPVACNSGSAPINGTVSGQTVNFAITAGTQTFTLTGTVTSDGSSMSGTYTSTAGLAPDGTPCGLAQTTGLQWKAVSVPPLTGLISGSFHSGGALAPAGEANRDFPVTGNLIQGQNIGASNATVTGTISFIDPTTNVSDYPCLDTASVNGEISGNTVVLQLIRVDGSNAGQIGISASQANQGGSGSAPVTFDPTPNGYVLHSTGTGYVVNTAACPNNATTNKEDTGYVCLALNGSTACQEPITLTPSALTFLPQMLGSAPRTQTITVVNNSGTTLNDLTLLWVASSGSSSDTGQTDFTNLPNFTESDNCAIPSGSTFSLQAGQSCVATVTFSPQEECTWLPNNGGTLPAQCPLTLFATLSVTLPAGNPTPDGDPVLLVPVKGTGLSFVQPSLPELDFGAEAFSEASLTQMVSFTNTSQQPVQILPNAPCSAPFGQFVALPHPLMVGSPVAGIQVVSGLVQDIGNSTVDYSCDIDPNTMLPNFRISSDTCSGTLLLPQASCSLEIAFAPQSKATYFSSLDYFLELNTVQCTDPMNDPPSQANPCEIDGGRFPVELKANIASTLRMSPGAGLDFGKQSVGTSVQKTIALFNDPADPNAATVNLIGKPLASGDYSEIDNCPLSLAPGMSCTLTVTFTPKATGNRSGGLTINYTTSLSSQPEIQPVYLRGSGQ
jgi:centrosomal CEP192-like protein